MSRLVSIVALLIAAFLASCSSSSTAATAPRLDEVSGLIEVSILARGME